MLAMDLHQSPPPDSPARRGGTTPGDGADRAQAADLVQYRAALAAAHEHALAWLDSVADRPIRPDVDAEGILARLDRHLPEWGAEPAAVIDELAEAAGPGLMAMGSPR